MSAITKSNTVILCVGSTERDFSDAAEKIESVIEALEAAREDGAEYVVMVSQDFSGPKWLSVGAETCAIDADD